MRYSFHGKVRATGQLVDGYVEAETSTEAIDRLADQGIIGVYSVRAEPKQPRNPVLLAGTPEFERAQFEGPDQPRQKRRALPAPAQLLAPQPAEAAPLAVPTAGVSDAVMTQLVDKLSILVGQVQKLLDRPAQVIYQSGGPAREGGKGAKRPSRNISDAQNSTLKDIFQNNLDLRRSLQKLSDTVAPTPAGTDGTPVVAEAAHPATLNGEPEMAAPALAGESEFALVDMGGADEEPPPPNGGLSAAPRDLPDLDLSPPPESGTDDLGSDLSMHVGETGHARHAQPAA